jgi:hypothetical protein
MKWPWTRALTRVVLAAVAAAWLTVTASAHHSFAMYDRSVQYVFTGVVARVNPDGSHLQIFFVPLNDDRTALLRDAKGASATWSVEMGGASTSARNGITVNAFTPGTVFSVGLIPLRNGQTGGSRIEGLFKCPKGATPKRGLHCDSVAGATSHGGEGLAKATAVWSPGRR